LKKNLNGRSLTGFFLLPYVFVGNGASIVADETHCVTIATAV